MKKLIAALVIASTFFASVPAHADECCYEGQGFADSRCCPSLVPAIAIGAVAIVAIVAVACQSNGGHGGHGHAH